MSEYTDYRNDVFAAEAYEASRDCVPEYSDYDPEPKGIRIPKYEEEGLYRSSYDDEGVIPMPDLYISKEDAFSIAANIFDRLSVIEMNDAPILAIRVATDHWQRKHVIEIIAETVYTTKGNIA
jgi:hypothetical protein